jgi:hypothetical protein
VSDLTEGMTPEERADFEEALRRDLLASVATLSGEERAKLDAGVRAKLEAQHRATRAQHDASIPPNLARRNRIATRLRSFHDAATLPLAIYFLLNHHRFDPAYRLSWWRRVTLGVRMFRNTRRITTGTSYRAHLAMAAKLFLLPPSVPGAVVECGCWKGGSTANLSLICDVVGRNLIVYDSFAGMPTAPPNDKYAWAEGEGSFRGDLEVVEDNVRRFGAIDRCTFRKGLFSETLPHHTEPVALAFVDVDYASSLHDCVLHLWPHLVDEGYLFIDEYVRIDYCALFFSERWWARYFDRPPPGMMGVGTGIGVGQYYLGPMKGRSWVQSPTSAAYTRKDFYGMWDYDPDDPDEVEKARGS